VNIIPSVRTAMNQSTEQMTARPNDTTLNIQHGCLIIQANDKGPRNTSSSSMDDTSMLSECDYAEC